MVCTEKRVKENTKTSSLAGFFFFLGGLAGSTTSSVSNNVFQICGKPDPFPSSSEEFPHFGRLKKSSYSLWLPSYLPCEVGFQIVPICEGNLKIPTPSSPIFEALLKPYFLGNIGGLWLSLNSRKKCKPKQFNESMN